MKKPKNPAARQYYRAFYQGNRLRFVLALVLITLNCPANLIGSWLLGEVIDVIAAGDLPWLWRTLTFTVLFVVAELFIGIAMYWAKSSFVYKALAQYKALAFKNLSAPSHGKIRAATSPSSPMTPPPWRKTTSNDPSSWSTTFCCFLARWE